MSNKSILQSNNEALSANNLDLQSLIDQANALPDAGGVELPELSNEGSASDLLSGKQLIDGDGNIVTGIIPVKSSSDLNAINAIVTVPAGYYASQAVKSVQTVELTDLTINVDSSGLIRAKGVQDSGYVEAGTISATKQLTTQSAKTITPTESPQTAVASGVYTTGAVTVGAIPSEYITTTDATASADEIMSGETAYVNGSKVTGTFSIDSELSAQDDLIAQIQAAVDSLPEAGGGEPTLQNKTVTPTENVQTVTADSGYNGLDTVTVNAIPNTYVQPATTKEATFYVPGTTDLYILPGTYCKGKQTIRGDSNLIPSNIKSGVRIFNVSGTLQEGSAGVGDIELCTCNMQTNGLPEPSVITIYYITSEMTLANIMFQAGKSFSCVKNSIIYTDGWNMAPSLSGNVSQISYSMGRAAYYVNGDFTLIQT